MTSVIASVTSTAVVSGAPSAREPFRLVLERTAVAPSPKSASQDPRFETKPLGVVPEAAQPALFSVKTTLSNAVNSVSRAQASLDHVLKLAMSGQSFTPRELLSIQARVYQSSQEIDLAGKVIEKASAGVKQVLQTQL